MSIVCAQFAEKFAEYKEAARLAKEKSQEKMEMATSPSQVGSLHTVLTLLLTMNSHQGHFAHNEQLVNGTCKEFFCPLGFD